MLTQLKLNVEGYGVRDTLPIADDDYVDGMWSETIDGEEWLMLTTAAERRFMAQANDAGGLNVIELCGAPATAKE